MYGITELIPFGGSILYINASKKGFHLPKVQMFVDDVNYISISLSLSSGFLSHSSYWKLQLEEIFKAILLLMI